MQVSRSSNGPCSLIILIAYPRLANLALPSPGIRFKQSPMPFVQMENISHFLRACQSPTLGLHTHDMFQTVDLYERKDPTQVLQCIGAFSRAANAAAPSRFPRAIGGKGRTAGITPQSTGGRPASTSGFSRTRGISNASSTVSSVPSSQPSQPYSYGGRASPTRSEVSSVNGALPTSPAGNISSWSKKADEGATTPAWNIHQYGYMGGASQGNQGIAFGARRQITTPGPKVPSLAEKERKRREEEAQAERLRVQAKEAERQRRIQREEEEERQRIADEERQAEEMTTRREQERLQAEEERRRWEEEERKWQLEEEARIKEEKELEARLSRERNQTRGGADDRLTGQFLSQYQASQRQLPVLPGFSPSPDRTRIEELERQLQEAKEREAQYERERLHRAELDRGRGQKPNGIETRAEARPAVRSERSKSRQRALPTPPAGPQEVPKDPGAEDERQYLQQQWSNQRDLEPYKQPLSTEAVAPTLPTRSLPEPTVKTQNYPPSPPSSLPAATNPTRPLPDPATYKAPAPAPAPAPEPAPSPLPTKTTPLRAQARSPFTRPSPTKPPPPTSSPTKPSSSPSPSPFSSSTTTPKPPSSLLAR